LYIETNIPIRRFSLSQKAISQGHPQTTLKCNYSHLVISSHPPFLPKSNLLIYKEKRVCIVEMQTLKK
ncbi:hypothetical protein, partial [Akkermansia sp.]|uniref:hypothetical protein n=1 Tax=Akkermansia sp. TaxID=1872421 RepID=UPI003AF464E6